MDRVGGETSRCVRLAPACGQGRLQVGRQMTSCRRHQVKSQRNRRGHAADDSWAPALHRHPSAIIGAGRYGQARCPRPPCRNRIPELSRTTETGDGAKAAPISCVRRGGRHPNGAALKHRYQETAPSAGDRLVGACRLRPSPARLPHPRCLRHPPLPRSARRPERDRRTDALRRGR